MSFGRLLIIANVTSLEIQVTSVMTPLATSAFQSHSLLSTIYTVQGVVAGEFASGAYDEEAKSCRKPRDQACGYMSLSAFSLLDLT